MQSIKRLIKSSLRSRGYYLSVLPGFQNLSPDPLCYHGIELLIDVGANIGQFAQESRDKGYVGKIVSFEPLPDAHAVVSDKARDDPAWFVHERSALGSQSGTASINVSENSFSSSLLPASAELIAAAPGAAYVDRVETPVVTLDSVFDRYRTNNEKTFLKIDTQGFEWEVLQGALTALPHIFGARIELSILPLYEGQKLYLEIMNFMDAAGFTLNGIIPVFGEVSTGQLLQFDAVYIR